MSALVIGIIVIIAIVVVIIVLLLTSSSSAPRASAPKEKFMSDGKPNRRYTYGDVDFVMNTTLWPPYEVQNGETIIVSQPAMSIKY